MRSCERHGAGTENGKEYTVVNIAYWFHNWPHIPFTFRPIDNDMFNFGQSQYMRSLAFLAVLTLFICLIILVVYLIFSFVVYVLNSRHQNSNKDKEKAKNNQSSETSNEKSGIAMGWKIVLFFVAILCGFGSLFGFYGVWKVYVGLGALHNSTRDGVNLFKSIKEDFGGVDLLNPFNLNGLVQNLKENIESFHLISDISKQLTNVLEKIVEYVNQTNEEVIKANIPLYNLSRIDVEWIYEDIESYGNIFCEILLLIVTILGITGLLFICGVLNTYMLAIFTIIAIIGIILNAFLMSIGLSATVLVSDLCVDAKPFIKEELNEWVLYQYLVECPLSESPITGFLEKTAKLATNVKESYRKLFAALNTIINVHCNTSERVVNFGVGLFRDIISDINIPRNTSIFCPLNIRQKLSKTLVEFDSQLNSYTQLINTLKSIADCNRINKDLYDSLESICGDINPGLVFVYFYSIFSFLCLIFILFCATFALITISVKLDKKIPKKKKFPKKQEIKK